MHEYAVALVRAGEVALGQRRAFARTLILLADKGDASLEPAVAKTFGGLGGGQATTDDDDCPRAAHHAPFRPCTSSRNSAREAGLSRVTPNSAEVTVRLPVARTRSEERRGG